MTTRRQGPSRPDHVISRERVLPPEQQIFAVLAWLAGILLGLAVGGQL